jgi:hypothetical protein
MPRYTNYVEGQERERMGERDRKLREIGSWCIRVEKRKVTRER